MIVAESIGKVDTLDDQGRVVIMIMIVMIVVIVAIVIRGGKGIMKYLYHAKTVNAAQTVAMGIVLESSSWVRQLWRSMGHFSSGVEMGAGDVLVVVG